MNAILAGVNAVPGVLGSAIFDAGDRCVAHLVPPPYEPELLQGAMRELRNAVTVLGYLEGAEHWLDLALQCDGGFLGFRRVLAHTILVLSSPQTNLAMLGVGTTVAARKLEQWFEQPGDRAGTGPLAATPAPPRREVPPKTVLDGIAVALARQIGPIANLLVEQELERLVAAGATVGARDLAAALAARVSDPQRRRDFLGEVEGLGRGR